MKNQMDHMHEYSDWDMFGFTEDWEWRHCSICSRFQERHLPTMILVEECLRYYCGEDGRMHTTFVANS